MNDYRPTLLSVCSGIGGLDLGVGEFFDARCIGYVEREAYACGVLVSRQASGELDPGPIFSDIADVPWLGLRDLVDIVAAGVPCQPFSQAGQRAGARDDRHVWPQLFAGLDGCRPACVVLENVDGWSTGEDPVLRHVLGDLEHMGYQVEAASVTASEVGCLHERRRWFVLAVSEELPPADVELLQEPGGPDLREDWCERGECWYGDCVACSPDDLGGRVAPDAFCERGRSRDSGRADAADAREPSRRAWFRNWDLEPDLGRVAHGVPDRVDRLRALGNAVVPHQATRALEILWGLHHGC